MANKKASVEVKQQGGSGFFWGLVLGLAVGFVVALLFAPQPGEVTRQQLLGQSGEFGKRGKDRYEETRAQLMERYGEALAQGREAYQRAKEQILAQYAQSKNGH